MKIKKLVMEIKINKDFKRVAELGEKIAKSLSIQDAISELLELKQLLPKLELEKYDFSENTRKRAVFYLLVFFITSNRWVKKGNASKHFTTSTAKNRITRHWLECLENYEDNWERIEKAGKVYYDVSKIGKEFYISKVSKTLLIEEKVLNLGCEYIKNIKEKKEAQYDRIGTLVVAINLGLKRLKEKSFAYVMEIIEEIATENEYELEPLKEKFKKNFLN